MDDDQAPDQATLFPKSTGDKLREAREALGLTLADIASRTRVPMRHLEAIELGDYSGLPSPTYSIGFAKSYARIVGLDEQAIAAEVRNNPQLPLAPATDYEAYQPRDAKRLPSRGLAMVAGAIGVLVLIAVVLWYGTSLFGGSRDADVAPPTENIITAAPEPTPTPVSGGQVTLIATGSVWLKIYDATGKTLLEKTMTPGERYDVPGDANNPMINVGRADQIQVTVNGSAVAPLGNGKVALQDVPISAAALQARGNGQPAATPTTTASPAPAAATATPRPLSLPPAFQPAATPTPRASPTPRPAPTPRAVPTPAVQPTSGTGPAPIP